MDQYLSDILENYLCKPAIQAMNTIDYPICTPENTIVTSSSGQSVTIIPKEHDYVLQAFPSLERYKNIKNFWAKIADCESDVTKFLAPILDFYDEIQTIKVKKVAPLNNFGVNINFNKSAEGPIRDQIAEAIVMLGEEGLLHGDPRLDNIGYDLDNTRYVLFDYDKAGTNPSVREIENNLDMFDRSMCFHTQNDRYYRPNVMSHV
jgi:hypothetical protein